MTDPVDTSWTTPDEQSLPVPAPRLLLRVSMEGGVPSTRQVELHGDFIRIGSLSLNDLQLSDPKVSRLHAQLTRGPRGWRLLDVGSLNGTRIGNISVRDVELPAEPCTISLGDSHVDVCDLEPTRQEESFSRPNFGALYGQSTCMLKMFSVLERASRSDSSVLIEGESGTGKELVATELVRRGPRASKPFIVVDCGAVSPTLIDAHLFGHARGAFTGADRERAGAFEAANGGTVFLDELGELPIEMQPKLLRVLEAREVRRLGETRPRPIDVRVIAATNRRLDADVNNGRFREDLFFRLSVVSVRVPPLRDRTDDIELLLSVILDDLDQRGARDLFTPEVLAQMRSYDWPGNVRELRNFVERTVVLQSATTDFVSRPRSSSTPPATSSLIVDIEKPFQAGRDALLLEFEREYASALLKWSGGNISRAARKARMDRMALHRIVQRHGLRTNQSLKDR